MATVQVALWVVIVLVALAILFDFMNGFHDAANSIATVVSTGVLRPGQAVVFAAFFNLIAIFIFHLSVAATVGKGIAQPGVVDVHVVFGALVGAISWNLVTWYYGIPSSSSHALIGGIVGAVIAKTGADQRIDAQTQARIGNRLHVDDVAQVSHVGIQVVVAMGCDSLQCLGVADALNPIQACGQQLIGPVLDPAGDIAVGRAAIAWVVFEATAFRRIVRRRDHNAVGQAASAATVVAKDGVGNRRCRGVLIIRRQHHLNAIGGQYFQCAGAGRRGQRVSVDTKKQRAVDALRLAVFANGLTDGQYMPLVKAQIKGAATMTRGAERHTLGADA